MCGVCPLGWYGIMIIFKNNLFISFWLCLDFVVMSAFSGCIEGGLLSSGSVRASHCSVFSCDHRLEGAWPSVAATSRLTNCGSQALKHRLSSCGTQAYLSRGTWDLSDQGSIPCLLHWQMDSLLLRHRGGPWIHNS